MRNFGNRDPQHFKYIITKSSRGYVSKTTPRMYSDWRPLTFSTVDTMTFEQGLAVYFSVGAFVTTDYNRPGPSRIICTGTLPTGTAFSDFSTMDYGGSGVIDGVPTVANESYNFTLTMYNWVSDPVSVSFSGTVTPFSITSSVTPTVSGGFATYVFTASGSFTVNAGARTATVLVVAGGGGGGVDAGGGGGAGGVYYDTAFLLEKGNRYVTVGAGGTSGVNGSATATSGSSSSILNAIDVTGGGRGGAFGNTGNAGGSSGGSGGWQSSVTTSDYNSYSSGPYYGKNGGAGNSYQPSPQVICMGGGGGASAVGGNAIQYAAANYGRGGNGGDGVSFVISGVTYTVGGGGGGGNDYYRTGVTRTSGGAGGGGQGQKWDGYYNYPPTGGSANTGGGGGGAWGGVGANAQGAGGGSGRVVIRVAV